MRSYPLETLVDRNNINLKIEVENLNNELFNGKIITNFEIKWVKGTKFTGKVKANIKTGNVISFMVNDRYELTYSHFLSIVAHELIHCYVIQYNLFAGRDNHSYNFIYEAERINNMIEFDKVGKDDEHSLKTKTNKEHLAVILKNNTTKDEFICIFNTNKEEEVYFQIMKLTHQKWFEDKTIIMMITDSKEIGNYPIKRKFKGEFYEISKELSEELLNGRVIKYLKGNQKL